MPTFKVTTPEEKIRRAVVPFVTFPLINVCTQKCVYCGDGAEMTLCNVKEANTKELLEWYQAARELGVQKFRVTGGEPLLHKDFAEIVRTIGNGANTVLVNTNATLIKKHHEKWKDSPPNCQYVVNYHGATEQTYDRVSGTTGHYHIARAGIEMLAAAGYLYRLNAVVNKHNIHEIWDIIAYCKELGTNLKIQDVVSVPWAFHRWNEVHVDTTELEAEFERRSTRERDHVYAMSFGTPTKIYTIDGVNITLKSVRNGSQYDMNGICKECSYFPCHEGIYDLFVFADNTAWACNWTALAKSPPGTKKEMLKYQIELFQRCEYQEARGHLTEEIVIRDEMPENSRLVQVRIV